MRYLKPVSWTGFVVSQLGMLGWAFVWPLTVDDNPASSVLRVGCLTTLFLFLSAIVGLLIVRLRTHPHIRSSESG